MARQLAGRGPAGQLPESVSRRVPHSRPARSRQARLARISRTPSASEVGAPVELAAGPLARGGEALQRRKWSRPLGRERWPSGELTRNSLTLARALPAKAEACEGPGRRRPTASHHGGPRSPESCSSARRRAEAQAPCDRAVASPLATASVTQRSAAMLAKLVEGALTGPAPKRIAPAQLLQRRTRWGPVRANAAQIHASD
jgi:hypothetical protein